MYHKFSMHSSVDGCLGSSHILAIVKSAVMSIGITHVSFSYGFLDMLCAQCTWNLERWSWWTYLQDNGGERHIQNRFVDTVREGEGGTNWSNDMETYITIRKMDTNENLLCDTGNSTWCSVTTCRGGKWWEMRGGSGGRAHVYTPGWFTWICCRGQHSIVKQLSYS